METILSFPFEGVTVKPLKAQCMEAAKKVVADRESTYVYDTLFVSQQLKILL
jgi:hypothetical protein